MIEALETDGFVVVPGPVGEGDLAALAGAYDAAFESGPGKIGTTSIRSDDFVNASPWFDPIYVHAPLIEAARAVIGHEFKLSAYRGRSLSPHVEAEEPHQDFRPLADGWPMVGFIFMVDAFSEENGATRFAPGSQSWPVLEADAVFRSACGPAGSMILYNGSIWHGHGANRTGRARRSIQGALIRRDQTSFVDHAMMTLPETAARLSGAAKALLCLI